MMWMILSIAIVLMIIVVYKIQHRLYKCENKLVQYIPTLIIGIYVLVYIYFCIYVNKNIWPGDKMALLSSGIIKLFLLSGLTAMIAGKCLAFIKYIKSEKDDDKFYKRSVWLSVILCSVFIVLLLVISF